MAHVTWVVALNNAIAIYEYERRRRANTEVEEIIAINRYTHPRGNRKLCRIVTAEVSELFFRCRCLPTRDKTVELRRTDND